jgi:hypothetical protein
VQGEETSASLAKGASRIDPQALEVLRRMSTTLGAAKAFTYGSTSILEVPAKTGQFITLFSTVELALKRPDKLRARLTGEGPHFDFYFDGATASAFAPTTSLGTTARQAPPDGAEAPLLGINGSGEYQRFPRWLGFMGQWLRQCDGMAGAAQPHGAAVRVLSMELGVVRVMEAVMRTA